MKIRVTKKHIEKGIRSDPSNCAIARGIEQATQCESLLVGNVDITIQIKGEAFCLSLPKIARDKIVAIDNGEKVRGFSFELAVPQ